MINMTMLSNTVPSKEGWPSLPHHTTKKRDRTHFSKLVSSDREKENVPSSKRWEGRIRMWSCLDAACSPSGRPGGTEPWAGLSAHSYRI